MCQQKIADRVAAPFWSVVCEVGAHIVLKMVCLRLGQIAWGKFGIFGQFDPKDALWNALALLLLEAQHAEQCVHFIGHGGGRTPLLDPPADEGLQIGRASCRERVEISVVAVSLKKKSQYRFLQDARVGQYYYRAGTNASTADDG